MSENKGPVLPRDEHGMIIPDAADALQKELVKKLINEERDFQKEMSFRNAASDRRDIIVKIVIYQRNSVNGKIVRGDIENPLFENLSDDPLHPYRYRYFEHIDGEIMAKEMPLNPAKVGRWQFGMFKTLTNYLARMGAFNGL